MPMKKLYDWVTFQLFKESMSKTENFLEDNRLIRSLANDEQDAFQQVYKDCFPMVTRSLQNMKAEPFEAEEVFHASLLVLYEKAKQEDFLLSCKVSTFLVAVARKKWLKQLEQNKKLTLKESEYAKMHENDSASVLFDIALIQEQEEKLASLHKALNELGSPCNELIKAFYIESMSMKAIAEKFEYTNADNAKTQKHKCLKRLKRLFFNDKK
jgi:RNA polymerase sigma factor (sigma-70 family)